jgi:CubicO group peptidase (beta-lactamase class C family)
MPDSPVSTPLPGGWSVIRDGDLLVVACPEKDLQLAFLARALSERMEELAGAAWREVEPGFNVPVRQQVEMPTPGGWKNTVQILYNTPGNEDRLAIALIRTLGNRAYITLIDGTKAGFSRRSAQMMEITNAWKPEGWREPSLAGIAPRQIGDDETRAMSSFVAAAREKLDIPGVAVAIVQDGRTVYAEGFGVKRAGSPEPVTPTTRFMIGSSTKPLTTLMMARLVDLGRFAWTTKVTEVLPEFALADADVTQRLEMRHTVCACTGMPRRDLDLIFRFRGVRPEDRIAAMKQMVPTTGLGETFQYSNYLVAAGGFAAAHSFAPDASLADAYDRAMRQLLFDPLKMGQTSVFHIDSPDDAAPHGVDRDGNTVPIDPVLEHFVDSTAPSGAVWSTVLDLAKYVRCELRQGLNDADERVVSQDNLMARRRSAIKIDDKNSYGLGLMLTDQQGLAEVSHDGNTLGFSAGMQFFPEHGIGLVVLTNMRAANLFLLTIHQRLLELLFGASSKAEAMVEGAATALKKSQERTRQRVRTNGASTAWLEAYVGRFACDELGPAEIRRNGDNFQIKFESWSSDLGVEEQSRDSRQIVLTSAPWAGSVRFQLSDNTDALILDGGQTRYKFSRIP